MSTPNSVLITSAGRRVELVQLFQSALARVLPEGGVHACDVSPLAPALRFADDTFLVPPCTDPDYADTLLTECIRRGIALVVPTIDTELMAIAAAKERFANYGIHVVVPSPRAVQICADKRQTNAFFREHGVPHVRQWTVPQAREVGLSNSPLIAKPARGSAGRGVFAVTSVAQLDNLGADHVVEEVAPGVEHTLDIYADKRGNIRAVVPRRRIETRGGEVSKGVTVRSETLDAVGRKIAMALSARSCVLTVQAFLAKDDSARVIEVNARFGGGYPLAYAAGAHFPDWLIHENMLQRDHLHVPSWAEGVLMLRYDQSIFVDPGSREGRSGDA